MQREWFKKIFEAAKVEPFSSEEEFDFIIKYFEISKGDEGFNIVLYC